MQPDEHVCLCFRVSLRKLVNYMNRTKPVAPSQLSDCLGAGTGCHWCVPTLCKLHEQWSKGQRGDLLDEIDHERYTQLRTGYRKTGKRSEPGD
ncbi:MAG: (2Fe-2S)-binding protein [Phycisphaerae bacterium]|nr:(2Fe-2S)-binding protein [Phycisphaerae bacterium]